MGEIVNHLKTSNLELKRICARAIFHLAEEEISRTTVRVQGGLGYLMELVKDKNNFHNLPLMAAGKHAKKSKQNNQQRGFQFSVKKKR